ncbi:glycosyltransferase family 1 protein [Candidatus Pacearchaeota archaeon CG10_big_fil_rev_8_21_14_0_10_32_14]|nr:MAG: glycosyltransferase family 1 protein [Candidatus Pacearchaeota archaeon CG10_big_fil_rev_8_21_14_0_10_32_14]
MKIGLITNNFDINNAGTGRYTQELMTRLKSLDKENDYIFIHTNKKSYGEDEYKLPFFTSIPKKLISGTFLLPIICKKASINVLHDPGQISPFFFGYGKTKKILSILDLSQIIYPENTTRLGSIYSKLLPSVCKRSDFIITISESTKNDLMKYYDIPPSKIKVIYLGADENYKVLPKTKINFIYDKYKIPKDYILYVGTLEPRKNIPNLLRAYAKIKSDINHKLVITGKKGWKYKEIYDTIDELKLENDVIFTGYVEEEDLPSIYNGASLFVYPSYYEGFGLPPLEAMSCGCPVITSNTSSIPEVVGDAGIMINPNDVDELAKQIKRVLSDKKLRENMKQKGLKQSKKFSWEKCAREHLEVYEEVI